MNQLQQNVGSAKEGAEDEGYFLLAARSSTYKLSQTSRSFTDFIQMESETITSCCGPAADCD